MNSKRFRDLAIVADLAFRLAQSKLNSIRANENQIHAQIQEIYQDRIRFQESRLMNDNTPPAQIVCESRWQKWSLNEEARRKQDLAIAKVESLKEVERVRQAMGKNEIIKSILKKYEIS
jgi:hypothetical protein